METMLNPKARKPKQTQKNNDLEAVLNPNGRKPKNKKKLEAMLNPKAEKQKTMIWKLCSSDTGWD